MRLIKIALAVLALSSCSPASTTHTVEVEGVPDEVARFVAAEEVRNANVEVSYQAGTNKAVFSAPTSEVQSDLRARATGAGLVAATKSKTTWGADTQ